MNSVTSKNNRGLKDYEYAGGYISYDPLVMTERYESSECKADNKSSGNFMANCK
ncbi:hypothetical protein [uncultured Clostridium sp.]|uniref:hypothetical protein n=1 Tax=uncultured Clostridium sp. TaxID=59620 RepID=UPI0025FB22E1|nr:hypothetical protein [uncultured Clostridium sp.]